VSQGQHLASSNPAHEVRQALRQHGDWTEVSSVAIVWSASAPVQAMARLNTTPPTLFSWAPDLMLGPSVGRDKVKVSSHHISRSGGLQLVISMQKQLIFFSLIASACLVCAHAIAEETDATLTFAARPPVAGPGHSTTLSGHAFIIIGLKTSHDIKEEVFGFYPVKDSLKGMIKGPGMLKAEERCGPEEECGPKHQDQLLSRLSESRTASPSRSPSATSRRFTA
jgi:hypothetical protein